MTTAGPNGRRRSDFGATLVQFNVNNRYNQSDWADSSPAVLPLAIVSCPHLWSISMLTKRESLDSHLNDSTMRMSKFSFERHIIMARNQSAGRQSATRPAAVKAAKPTVGSKQLGSHGRDIEMFLGQFDALEQRRQIREGMEASIIDRVAKNLLNVPVQTLLAGLGLPSSTILRKIAREERLSPAESDRVARVLYVFRLAMDVFENETLAAEWMQLPHAELAGLRPLEVLDSQPGYDRVRDLLMRVIYGIGA
ncbi:antitoxin Xre/MbcA/ParS toxin-binding domain-containing protein [Burkholderia cenocepacia]|uniref:antitoxin Xre/MbcA/ParS toxin-binding domain-containing protein n=2 Tax=Burkholderia TaxID=32008 RepID=UPI00320482EA